MFYQMAKKAQYYYYIKLRLATCMPSKCENNDLELLGKQGKCSLGATINKNSNVHLIGIGEERRGEQK